MTKEEKQKLNEKELYRLFDKGVYILQLSDGAKVTTQRIIKN